MWEVKPVVLRARGSKTLKTGQSLCEKSCFARELLAASLPGTAERGALALEPSVSQKRLQSCNAFPQGLGSIAKCTAEEITSQQKCAGCRKEATEQRQAGEAAFPLLFCCRYFEEQNKW